MDLIATLTSKIDALEDGEYTPGLKAVLLHIETAFRHLARGQSDDDDTAFTDAIYRTNQAFEGSIKEAYRVLADQDPAKKRPFDIEKYLEKSEAFRERVLKQFTTYRTEWRNPSAHDYKLDFDASEAFLAIVSVCAFACLLLDQITEKLSFVQAQAQVESQKASVAANLATNRTSSLLDRGVDVLKQFALTMPRSSSSTRQTELQFVGALHGFISSVAADVTVGVEERLVPDKSFRADLLLRKNDERVLVEVKRSSARSRLETSVAQVEHAMMISGITDAILIIAPDDPVELVAEQRPIPAIGGRIIILSAKSI